MALHTLIAAPPDLTGGLGVHVPACATCPGHCCKSGELVPLEAGDLPPTVYDAEPIIHPLTGKSAWALRRRPDGACVYFEDHDGVGRCAIYARRPLVCRAFDCGAAFAHFTRSQRRRMERAGLTNRALMAQGRAVWASRG